MARKKRPRPDRTTGKPSGSPQPQRGGARRNLYVAGAGALLLIILATVFFSRNRASVPATVGERDAPDIVLVTIDTLRWDALGYAGNSRVKTPFIDRLAREGRCFTNAHAHNVVTLPSHVNILTGLYPYQHGVRDNAGFVLAPEYPTIGAFLKESGYATAAFVGAFPLDMRFGLNRGFEVYDDKYGEGSDPLEFVIAERPAEEVLRAATHWYEANRDRKRFLWIHLYDPHAPYKPTGNFAEQYGATPYLGEVAATDAALAQYLGPIVDQNQNLLLILTGDHGESLGDHGELTHGLFAYESTLKIPLIVHEQSRVEPGQDSRFVRHIDIVPTILARVGLQKTPKMQGESLLMEGTDRETYFEALSSMLNRGWAPLVGMIQEGHKYIDLPLPELYDLTSDSAEQRNLVEERRRTVFKIRKLLADRAPAATQADRKISPEEGAKLLSLGYITGTAARKEYTVEDDPKNLLDVDSMMLEVVHLYQLGQLDRAVQIAQEVVRRRPGMGVGEEMLAFVLQQDQKFDAAIETLEQALARGTASDSMKNRLGLMLSEMGRAKEAVEILAPLAKNNPDTLNAYGIALADVGKPAEAIRQFEEVLAIDPTNAAAYQNLGVVALRRGDAPQARAYLMEALKLNDMLPLALTTLGVIQANEGEIDAAMASWSKAVNEDPRQYDALYNLGIVATRVGRFEQARGALREFLKTAPPKRYKRELDKARRLLAQVEQRQS